MLSNSLNFLQMLIWHSALEKYFSNHEIALSTVMNINIFYLMC